MDFIVNQINFGLIKKEDFKIKSCKNGWTKIF